jgi:hypothetical protein
MSASLLPLELVEMPEVKLTGIIVALVTINTDNIILTIDIAARAIRLLLILLRKLLIQFNFFPLTLPLFLRFN